MSENLVPEMSAIELGTERSDSKLVIEIVEPAMARILGEKSESERLRIAWGMWRSARDRTANLLRAEHRDWSEQQVRQATAKRLAHGTN